MENLSGPKKISNYFLIFFVSLFFFFLFANVRAQNSDGTSIDPTQTPGGTSGSTVTPVETNTATTPTTQPSSEPTSTSTPTTTPGSVKPKTAATKPVPKIAVPPASPITEVAVENSVINNSPSGNWIIVTAVSALVLGILGFLGMNLKKEKKPKEEEKEYKKCLNIKKLLEDKLSELTDLKGQLTEFGKDKAVEALHDALDGTRAVEVLSLIEKAQKEYDRLNDLYEKCIGSISFPKTTLLFLYKRDEKKILLAMKKRRFGAGKWNGIGGKLNEGESIIDGLIREAKEEINVDIDKIHLNQVATINFTFKDNNDWNQQTHVFFADTWSGEPTETEEMRPEWHSVDSLPFDNMWVDDVYWLPLVIGGKKLKASFNFDKTGNQILKKEIKEI